jgi:uncharacterized repeat protein (TIGR03803 family)
MAATSTNLKKSYYLLQPGIIRGMPVCLFALRGKSMAGIFSGGCRYLIACLFAIGTIAFLSPARAQTFETLYSFLGAPPDGLGPLSKLVSDSNGNLYGTTDGGGGSANCVGCGTVFRISPNGHETLLHSFGGAPSDGAHPYAGLAAGASGYFYGTTHNGGAYGFGSVYKIDQNGSESLVHSFRGGVDGSLPSGDLLVDKGFIYGTTETGGASGYGTVFKLGTTGTITQLYAFKGADGAYPAGGLIVDTAGNFYGTTNGGGGQGFCTTGCGTVFKLAPNGAETVLHAFAQGNDGGGPWDTLVADSSGNLYGTTGEGGQGEAGTLFKVTPGGILTILYTFTYQSGGGPVAGLIRSANGNLYGTTTLGGKYENGTVFMLEADGKEITLHSFSGLADGAGASGGLLARDENLYGATNAGGPPNETFCPGGCGTVYKLSD